MQGKSPLTSAFRILHLSNLFRTYSNRYFNSCLTPEQRKLKHEQDISISKETENQSVNQHTPEQDKE